jgi:hypothetical protein
LGAVVSRRIRAFGEIRSRMLSATIALSAFSPTVTHGLNRPPITASLGP